MCFGKIPHGQIKGCFYSGLCLDVIHCELDKDWRPLWRLFIEGSGGWEMSGTVRYTYACWCDVRAVFMRHHKYACCFVLYGGIYDSGVAVFVLSEVIYLSSSLTVGMKREEDNYTSHQPYRMNLKEQIFNLTLWETFFKFYTFSPSFDDYVTVICIVEGRLNKKNKT